MLLSMSTITAATTTTNSGMNTMVGGEDLDLAPSYSSFREDLF